MKKYIFKTVTTMKEYNQNKWWIDSNIVGEICIKEINLEKAIEKYKKIVEKQFYIDISKNAIKNKKPMYIDTDSEEKQIGYVITGQTDFQKEDYSWSRQYIDLWVEILTVENTVFV